MANPSGLPPETMAAQFGVGKLQRHLFICVGPDCVDAKLGEAAWDYLKKRLKQLNIAGPDGSCYRTRCQCLRICIDGPVGVVYPEGTWYRRLNTENIERVIQEHLIGGRVVEDLCFARNPLPQTPAPPQAQTIMTNDRLTKLLQMLSKAPADPFLLYAIAMEHKKAGEAAEAVRHLQLTLEKDPAYIAAYLQLGQIHAQAGDVPAARQALTAGIAKARQKGDNHAASEMEQLLGMLQ